MKSLELDLETFSGVSLSKSGLYRYAESPDFEILLFGFSVDYGAVQVVDLACGEKVPDDVLAALTDDTIVKYAHHSTFERICLSRYLGYPTGEYINPTSWRCSMVWAAYMGLPLSLEGVGTVLHLDKQKLSEGKELIKYFCQPCAPTEANGHRTRNYPHHAPEKWSAFRKYNIRDVEAEMSVREKLAKFPVPESIWDEYHLDQEINDRGAALDMTLVKEAIGMDERSRSELIAAMQKLTELENPNSVAQMKDWLSYNGMETDTLGKKTVAEMMKTAPPELHDVLSLRQQLAKSSVRKYTAMENAVCADGRARGMFVFYGANRTGRWAGRLIQMQNLPQNHLQDLAEARSLVRSGDFDALEMLYGDVPGTLSQLIRTAFVPRSGFKFIVADFSSIEAVVLAWLAGEKWTLDAYAAKRDLYIENAEIMFGIPKGSIDKKSPLRQKSKVAVLACIAEGQLVLTNKGLVPIEKITIDHRLWDGENWVKHEGVIYKGERKVIEYDGLVATADHLVWIEGQSEPIQFGIAASRKAHLIQTGDGRRAIRLGDYNISGKAMDGQKNGNMLCSHAMPGMRLNTVDTSKQSDPRHIGGMSKLFSTETDTDMVRQTINSGKTTLRKSKRSKISLLRGERNKILLCKRNRSRSIYDKYFWFTKQKNGTRQDRQQRRLCERKFTLCHTLREQFKQARYCSHAMETRILALQSCSGYTQAVKRFNSRTNYSRCGNSSIRKAEELENYKRTARLYDIRNAGRHHRFTVSGKLVHNCGYQGSVGALKAFGALDMGLKEEELKPLVDAWRTANPNIVRFWREADKAAVKAVGEGTTARTHGIEFGCHSGILFITLPGGRKLSYIKPRMDENRFGMKCVTYEGVGTAKKWERIESSPGKWVENITQAVARDLLYNAMSNLRGYNIVMHIHDEIVIEAKEDTPVKTICKKMCELPPWAKGLPLRAEGYECGFYKKD